MTPSKDEIIDSEIQTPETQEKDETVKSHIPAPKVSRFGSQPSKFGKNPTQTFQNPIQKGRPGRAAARGR